MPTENELKAYREWYQEQYGLPSTQRGKFLKKEYLSEKKFEGNWDTNPYYQYWRKSVLGEVPAEPTPLNVYQELQENIPGITGTSTQEELDRYWEKAYEEAKSVGMNPQQAATFASKLSEAELGGDSKTTTVLLDTFNLTLQERNDQINAITKKEQNRVELTNEEQRLLQEHQKFLWQAEVERRKPPISKRAGQMTEQEVERSRQEGPYGRPAGEIKMPPPEYEAPPYDPISGEPRTYPSREALQTKYGGAVGGYGEPSGEGALLLQEQAARGQALIEGQEDLRRQIAMINPNLATTLENRIAGWGKEMGKAAGAEVHPSAPTGRAALALTLEGSPEYKEAQKFIQQYNRERQWNRLSRRARI